MQGKVSGSGWPCRAASRRNFLLASFASVLAPRLTWAQAAQKTYRIGWFRVASWANETYNVAFVERLRELGFVEGRNLVFESRDPGVDNPESLAALAADMVRQKCDLLFSGGAEGRLVAMKQASRDTPIVIVSLEYDPVASGHVKTLARPGGLVTGVSPLQSVLPAKRLELLKELVPTARKIAVFTNAATTGQLGIVQEAARKLGISLHVVDLKRPPLDIEAAFADVARAKADALFVLVSGWFIPSRRRIAELALKHRLPLMVASSQSLQFGGLVSYGFDPVALYRRAAEQAAAILRGAKAADLPIEQGTKFELVVNLKTAKALGLKVPQSVLLRADRVIE